MSIDSRDIKSITDIQHVLCKRGMYIGSDVCQTEKMVVYDDQFIVSDQTYQQSTQKLFDEIIQNSIDNYFKNPTRNYMIEIVCNQRSFSVKNNGRTFDLSGDYQDVARIFSALRTSDQYGKSNQEVSGTNGLGAKLVRLCSKEFQIFVNNDDKLYNAKWFNSFNQAQNQTDEVNKYVFQQTINENEDENDPYFKVVVKLIDQGTQIHFDGVTETLNFYDLNTKLIEKYVIDLQMAYPEIKFVYNKKAVPKFTLNQFMQMNGVEKFIIEKKDRLNIVIFDCTPSCLFKRFTLINGIQTFSKEGNHYESVKTCVRKDCCLKGKLDLGLMFIGQFKGLVFSEQIKTVVKNKISIELSQESIQFINSFSIDTKKDKKPKFIQKLREANNMKESCSLIVTEGDSASCLFKNIQMNQHDFFDNYGLFPLKGKILSVKRMGESPFDCQNQEIQNLIQIIGLKNITYTSLDQLRYQHVIIASDFDVDGFHICGLFISFIQRFWPELIQLGFLQRFVTPIIIATIKGKSYEFFSETKFKQDTRKFSNVQYFKGLGSFNKSQTKTIGEKFVEYVKDINGEDEDDLIKKLFVQESEGRKQLILQYKPTDIDLSGPDVKIDDCMQQVVEYSINSLQRAIPGFVDGMKESQRKIIYWMLKHKNMKEKIKVSIMSGSVSSDLDYHHGEVSLQDAICKLAQDFTGTNNCNLLQPEGSFGNRFDPAAIGSPRYVYVLPSKWLHKLFNDNDKLIYKYRLSDDREQIEPETLFPIIPIQMVNGADGIATGWSTKMFCYSLDDVVKYIKAYLEKKRLPQMIPSYNGYTGSIELEVTNDKTYMNCRGDFEFTETSETKGSLTVGDTAITSSLHQMEEFLIENKIQHKKNKQVYIHNIENEMIMKIVKKFLITKEQMTNMTFMDGDQVLQFTTIQQFMKKWIDRRLSIYQLRKKATMIQLVQQYIVQYNYKRFVDEKLMGKDSIDDLILRFTPMNAITNNQNPDLYQVIKQLESDKEVVSKMDHDYLLDKTVKFYHKYDPQQLLDIKNQYDTYSKIEAKQLWIQDLDNINK